MPPTTLPQMQLHNPTSVAASTRPANATALTTSENPQKPKHLPNRTAILHLFLDPKPLQTTSSRHNPAAISIEHQAAITASRRQKTHCITDSHHTLDPSSPTATPCRFTYRPNRNPSTPHKTPPQKTSDSSHRLLPSTTTSLTTGAPQERTSNTRSHCHNRCCPTTVAAPQHSRCQGTGSYPHSNPTANHPRSTKSASPPLLSTSPKPKSSSCRHSKPPPLTDSKSDETSTDDRNPISKRLEEKIVEIYEL